MPQITRPQVYRVVREMLPREKFGPAELLRWLEERSYTRSGSAALIRSAAAASAGRPQNSCPESVVVILN